MAAEPQTIYAKVDSDLAAFLKKAATGLNRSQSSLLGEFIGYFRRAYLAGGGDKNEDDAFRRIETVLASDHDQLESLKDTDQLISNVLYLSSWAEHSFQRRFYPWAIEAYSELHKEAEGGHLIEMQRIASYRLGFCWMRLALTLRHEAIQKFHAKASNRTDLMEGLDSAITASARAAAYFDAINHFRADNNEGGWRENPVGYYNKACALSVFCQYSIENVLLGTRASDELIEEILSASRDDKDDTASEAKECFVPLPGWRDLDPKFVSQIDMVVETIFELLDKVPTQALDRNRFPAESQWLVELAVTDSDLNFVKNDEQYRARYQRWERDWAGKHTARQSYDSLSKLVSSEMKKRADRIVHPRRAEEGAAS